MKVKNQQQIYTSILNSNRMPKFNFFKLARQIDAQWDAQ